MQGAADRSPRDGVGASGRPGKPPALQLPSQGDEAPVSLGYEYREVIELELMKVD